MKVSHKDVRSIVEATFPEYTGRKIVIEVATKVGFYGLNWDGGSRNQYRACTIDGMATGGADENNAQPPWRNQAEGKVLPLPAGFVVVEHSIFCGRDTGLTIYVNPADMPKWIAAGTVAA